MIWKPSDIFICQNAHLWFAFSLICVSGKYFGYWRSLFVFLPLIFFKETVFDVFVEASDLQNELLDFVFYTIGAVSAAVIFRKKPENVHNASH
jgi:hypothetical protein